MMKKMIALILTLALAVSLPVVASAAETTEARVPVTLTVINTERPISVTVPAALPVSVVDGEVLVANNAKITNNAKTGSVQVSTNSNSNAVLVCFAPYEDPEVAVAIVVERGGSGSELGSIGAEILGSYFTTRSQLNARQAENVLLR